MSKSSAVIDSIHLYDRYFVVITVRNRLCGGIPKNAELLKSWIEAGTGHQDEQSEKLTEEAREQMIDATTEKSWIGFYRDPALGLYIETRLVKAMFKECASVLLLTVKKRGSKQILQHGFEIKDEEGREGRIYLRKHEPDGRKEGPIHVMTAQGPRTALKRVDYVVRPTLKFQVWVLKTAPAETRHLGEKDLREILALAQENGLGADRSQEEGKFTVDSFERLKYLEESEGD